MAARGQVTLSELANALGCAVLDPRRAGSIAEAVEAVFVAYRLDVSTDAEGGIDHIVPRGSGLPPVHHPWEAMTVAYPKPSDRVAIVLTPSAIEAALQHQKDGR